MDVPVDAAAEVTAAAARPSRRLIVNADDFGLTGGVSRGILRAHREGLVTSTTVLASLPPQPELDAAAVAAPGSASGFTST